MRSVETEQRGILRYFYYFVAVAGIATTFLVVSVYQRYAAEAVQDRVANFHLHTLTQVREVSAALAAAELARTRLKVEGQGGWATEGDRLEVKGQLSAAVHSIDRSVASIGRLRHGDADEKYRNAVRRLRVKFDGVRQAFEDEGLRADYEDQLAAFRLSIYQLDRLHSIDVERAVQGLGRASGKRTRQLVSLASVVLVLTVFVLWRLFVLLRFRLRRHSATRKALFERERELMQAQKMEALGTLVGGVAHDFNNLLTAVLGNVELLRAETPEGESPAVELTEIRKAAERAAGLTRQLLVFGRKDQAETGVVDLKLLFLDMEVLLRRLIRADIELTLSAEQDLWLVEADRVQMEQVLINLSVNASDAMPQGGDLTIDVSNVRVGGEAPALATIPAGSYVRTRVRDTGLGMSPDVQSRAFEPFFTTKESGKGTGLGLSTVHGIVTRNNGYILVESASGHGTIFDVYLPRSDGAAIKTGERAAEAPRGTETILLAEDDDQVRALVSAGLRSAGYTVIDTADAEEALEVCKRLESPVDLLMSDVVMPRMRGDELAQRVLEFFPGIGVVFISGYFEEEVLERVRELGSPLVAKPFKMHHLLRVVRQELDARREFGRSAHGM